MSSLWWALIQCDWCHFLKRGPFGYRPDTHGGKMMCRDRMRRHSATSQIERPEKDSSLITLRRNQQCWHLDFWLPASRNMRMNFCCLSHTVYNTLLWQLYQTNTLTLNVNKTVKKLIMLLSQMFYSQHLDFSLWFYIYSPSLDLFFYHHGGPSLVVACWDIGPHPHLSDSLHINWLQILFKKKKKLDKLEKRLFGRINLILQI